MEFPHAERKPQLFLIEGHKKICFHSGPESDWGKKQKNKNMMSQMKSEGRGGNLESRRPTGSCFLWLRVTRFNGSYATTCRWWLLGRHAEVPLQWVQPLEWDRKFLLITLPSNFHLCAHLIQIRTRCQKLSWSNITYSVSVQSVNKKRHRFVINVDSEDRNLFPASQAGN